MPPSIGGVIFITIGGEIQCTDCMFFLNFAGNGGVIGNFGGSVYFYQSFFKSNSATSGGVYYSQNNDATTKKSYFIDCIFMDNTGKDLGGVFDIESTILHVNNSIFHHNILLSSTDNRGGVLSSSNSTCIFYNINVTNSYAAVGGAFLCTQESTIYITNGFFENIYSTNNGGVIRTEYNTKMWIYNTTFKDCSTEGNGGVMNIQATTTVNIEDSLFLNCFSGGLGGNIYITTNSEIIFTNSTFQSGYAKGSGGCIGSNAASITLIGGIFSDSKSSSGGAIYLQSSKLKSKNTLFLHNYGDQGGSILGDANTEINLDNVQFQNNSAVYKGGAILLTGGYLISSNTIFNNSHSDYGGAIHASVGTRVILLNSLMIYNTATYEGGAITIQSGDNSYFNGTFFGYNRANTGAVMYITNSHVNIWKSEFKSNFGSTSINDILSAELL